MNRFTIGLASYYKVSGEGELFQAYWLLWLILSSFMVKLFYNSVPGHKGLTILAACMGSSLGVKIWRDHVGPFVFPDETDPPK